MLVVSGASGNVGGQLVRALAEAGETVRALTRAAQPTPPRVGVLPDGAQAVTGDLDRPETLAAALAGARGVFLLPGYRDMPGVLAAIRGAGVQRVVLLSGGSAASGDQSNAISAYMIRSEAAVRDSGVPFTILRPAGFMSNTLRWVPQLRAGDLVREPFGDVRVAVIDPGDIAAVAAAALRQDGHTGRTYTLSGPEPLLPADRVRILGEVLGRPLRFDPMSKEEARTQMSADMPAEYVEAFFDFYVAGSLDESAVHPVVEQILGRSPRTFTQWARAHTAEFQ